MKKYFIECEGKQLITEFSLAGFDECRKFVYDNATDPNKRYQVKVIEINEEKIDNDSAN